MTAKIVVYGDSVAKGIQYDTKLGRYVHSDSSFIQLFCQEHGFELTDRSLFGCNLKKAEKIARRHPEEIRDSDAVFIMLGGNDCNFNWREVAESPEEEHECCTPPEEFFSGYKEFIDYIRQQGGSPIIFNMVPVLGRKYFSWISRSCSGENVMKFLGCPERIEHWNEMYSLMLQKISEESAVPIVDLRSVLLWRRDIESLYCPDGIHPNIEGQKLLCRASDSAISSLIS